MKLHKLFFILCFFIASCASNTRYTYEKVFDSNMTFQQAKAECEYQSHLQNRADRRLDRDNSLSLALFGLRDPTETACMKRFGYELRVLPNPTDDKEFRNTNTTPDKTAEEMKLKIAGWQKNLEIGDSEAEINLAYLYLNGNYVDRDFVKAMNLYTRAAQRTEQNMANAVNAQTNLGFMYERGYGVRVDYYKAMMWYQIASSSKNIDAVKKMNMLQPKMTSEQLEVSKQMAIECWNNKFVNCDKIKSEK